MFTTCNLYRDCRTKIINHPQVLHNTREDDQRGDRFCVIKGVQHPVDNDIINTLLFDDYVVFNKNIYYHVVTNTHTIATKKTCVSISFICSA